MRNFVGSDVNESVDVVVPLSTHTSTTLPLQKNKACSRPCQTPTKVNAVFVLWLLLLVRGGS